MTMQFKPMADLLKPGKIGEAELTIFEVTPEDAAFTSIREAATGGREQAVPPGKYTKLKVKGCLMMTDTPMEQRTNMMLLHHAKGEVLIAGLGVGMVLVPLLANPKVTSILVIEKFKDVIDLVAPFFQDAIDDGRLHIINEDIFDFRPQEDWTWDTIYFDIWPDICADNLPEMERLHNQYRFHLSGNGWMSSWEYTKLRRGGLFRDLDDDGDDEWELGGVEFEPEDEDDDY